MPGALKAVLHTRKAHLGVDCHGGGGGDAYNGHLALIHIGALSDAADV